MAGHKGRMTGLTLVELMVAMAVLVVMLTIAVPSFQGMLERTRAATANHQLTASLMMARAAAVTRRQPVTVCPSADGEECRRDLVWEDGWIIFADPDKLGSPADADAVIQRFQALGGGLLVRSSRGRPLIRYQPNGRASGSNLSLRVCHSDQQLLAKVVVNNVGRARTEQAGPGDRCDPAGA
ncbi:Tfp pilus assembly protein FimT/FimU [Lysobacter sp. GX 14042]|uniref:GspH/FimT family pseudopilin n=1 Tax=Lysobacter sp. GX 14042 TaxID=2907155 RepID=UPI001F37A85C|nr:Tfp pilus assembly protein FimT/FimU [Lysobacter sp. GX 14042]MCE7031778.1 Tfp pilus assembly protein FimT/FimU [Lysobacter sp. GX 14042]